MPYVDLNPLSASYQKIPNYIIYATSWLLLPILSYPQQPRLAFCHLRDALELVTDWGLKDLLNNFVFLLQPRTVIESAPKKIPWEIFIKNFVKKDNIDDKALIFIQI